MFTIHAFQGSVATSSTPAYTNLTPLPDPIATVSGNLLYVGALNNLLGAFVMGANFQRAKLESPSLLNIAPFMITPQISSALPTATMEVGLQASDPVALVTNEAIQAYAFPALSGSASDTLGIIALGDGAVAPVTGKIIHARATVTTPATANTWGNASITFDTVLPAGSYQLVGTRVEGSHVRAFRVVFQGNSNFRPGSLAALGTNGVDVDGARNGGWGVWGTFDQFTPPSFDLITDGTSETASIYLDLIKSA